MVERDEGYTIERTTRDLAALVSQLGRERSLAETAQQRARADFDAASAELPKAEQAAKVKRQAQNDAIRGRADLERRLHELLETEALARTRRQQAEQRATGFRAAATFAASGRIEADGSLDPDRAERERLVEARAAREAAAAEARATEERVEEQKIAKLRAEVERHVMAEREVELEFAREREEAERRVEHLVETLERTQFLLHESEVVLERLSADYARACADLALAEGHLRDYSRRNRGVLEARIAELRRIEIEAVREREEHERALAVMDAEERAQGSDAQAHVEAQTRAEADRAAAQQREFEQQEAARVQAARVEEDRIAAARAEMKAQAEEAAVAPPVREAKSSAHISVPLTSRPNGSPNGTKTGGSISFIRPIPTVKPAPAEADEELIPGLKNLMGRFARPKSEPPPPPPSPEVDPEEGQSIADRIARDFGLLGGS